MTYPVNLDVAGERVLVVGGGPVAARKAAGLLRAGAAVTVVAPDAVPELANDPDVRWHQRAYQRGEAASYKLVFTATDGLALDAILIRPPKDIDGPNATVVLVHGGPYLPWPAHC